VQSALLHCTTSLHCTALCLSPEALQQMEKKMKDLEVAKVHAKVGCFVTVFKAVKYVGSE
jgi:cytochrome b561